MHLFLLIAFSTLGLCCWDCTAGISPWYFYIVEHRERESKLSTGEACIWLCEHVHTRHPFHSTDTHLATATKGMQGTAETGHDCKRSFHVRTSVCGSASGMRRLTGASARWRARARNRKAKPMGMASTRHAEPTSHVRVRSRPRGSARHLGKVRFGLCKGEKYVVFEI